MVPVTGVGVFDASIQESNEWFDELMGALHWQDKYRTYLALRITLHSVRDMLQPRSMAEVGNALPMLIRGLYFEGWTGVEKLSKRRGRTEFLNAIREYFNSDPAVEPSAIARSVFRLLIKSMTRSEIEDINEILPAELRDLWAEEKVK